MSKTAVVYWSGTGNTAAMADAVVDGVKSAGGQPELFTAESFNSDMVDNYDFIAFGCPSMGCEQLEDTEFEPMFDSCKNKLKGKKIALFGSYGWGDGEWMRSWEKNCDDAGVSLACDSIICQEAPDDDTLASCRAMGKTLAE